MKRKYYLLILSNIFIFISLFFLSSPKSLAAVTGFTSPEYYSNVTDVPYTSLCIVPCGPDIDCWNAATPYQSTSCGDACIQGSGPAAGLSWTKYHFTNTTCYSDPNDPTKCIPAYIVSGATCSTADKYNQSNYGSGDTTMLRAGTCVCQANEIFKTCCSGTTAVPANNVGGNPNFPDGACGANQAVPCGADPSIYSAMGYTFPSSTNGVSCGTPACQYFLGTPTPSPTATGYNCVNNSSCQASTNGPGTYSTLSGCQAACGTSCPTYAPPAPTGTFSCPYGTTCTAQGTAQTVQTACSPTNFQCSPNCSITCTDSQGHTCPATSCTTVWACQGSQWHNGGQYYYTCPQSCPNCTIGATQTTCGPTSACHAP